MDDTRLKRAGLDYHDLAHVTLDDDLQSFRQEVQPARLFACTTKARRLYTQPSFQAGDALMFGPETRGLPDALLDVV